MIDEKTDCKTGYKELIGDRELTDMNQTEGVEFLERKSWEFLDFVGTEALH